MEWSDDALRAAEQEAQNYGDAFEIYVRNKWNNWRTSLMVYPANIVEQVFEATARRLEIRSEIGHCHFENARTRCCASDWHTTIQQLGLQSGDTLDISVCRCDCD